MGCYLGSNIFRTSDTTASIVCNGRKDVECSNFPADRNYDVYLLETNSQTGALFGGGTVYLEYFNGSTWVQIDSYTMPGTIGPGYAWVSFNIITKGWSGRMRLRNDSDGCIKEWLQGAPCIPSYKCREPKDGYEHDTNNCSRSIDRLNSSCNPLPNQPPSGTIICGANQVLDSKGNCVCENDYIDLSLIKLGCQKKINVALAGLGLFALILASRR